MLNGFFEKCRYFKFSFLDTEMEQVLENIEIDWQIRCWLIRKKQPVLAMKHTVSHKQNIIKDSFYKGLCVCGVGKWDCIIIESEQ